MLVTPRLSARLAAACRFGPAIVVLALGALVGCGAPQSFDGTTYRQGRLAFRVGPIPPQWKSVKLQGAALAFRDEPHGASILLDARCDHEDTDTPLAALTDHLLSGTTERQFDVEETVPFDAREARHTMLHAKLDGVLLAYDVYVLKKDGCTYDFVFVASTDGFEAGRPSFQRFALGFSSLGGPR
jgi:hypothetical protein